MYQSYPKQYLIYAKFDVLFSYFRFHSSVCNIQKLVVGSSVFFLNLHTGCWINLNKVTAEGLYTLKH